MTTTMQEILDEEKNAQAERQRKADAAYRKLVADVTAGRKPTPEHRAAVLSAAGRGLKELASDVEQRQRRIDLGKLAARLPDLAAEKTDTLAKIARADDDLSAAQQRHTELAGPLLSAAEQLRVDELTAKSARDELVAGCADDDLREKLKAIDAQIWRVSTCNNLSDTVEAGRMARVQLADPEHAARTGFNVADLRKDDAAGKVAEQEMARIAGQVAALQKTRDAIVAEMLLP